MSGAEPRRREVRMPPEWWDDRAITVWCPVCERDITERSIYLNLDMLERRGITQAEWVLSTHRGMAHSLNRSCWECRFTAVWAGGRLVKAPRCPNGCPDGPTLDLYRSQACG